MKSAIYLSALLVALAALPGCGGTGSDNNSKFTPFVGTYTGTIEETYVYSTGVNKGKPVKLDVTATLTIYASGVIRGTDTTTGAALTGTISPTGLATLNSKSNINGLITASSVTNYFTAPSTSPTLPATYLSISAGTINGTLTGSGFDSSSNKWTTTFALVNLTQTSSK
jgi:hypothetical protein